MLLLLSLLSFVMIIIITLTLYAYIINYIYGLWLFHLGVGFPWLQGSSMALRPRCRWLFSKSLCSRRLKAWWNNCFIESNGEFGDSHSILRPFLYQNSKSNMGTVKSTKWLYVNKSVKNFACVSATNEQCHFLKQVTKTDLAFEIWKKNSHNLQHVSQMWSEDCHNLGAVSQIKSSGLFQTKHLFRVVPAENFPRDRYPS